MAISNAEMLDTVRRLRTYMTTIDSCHVVFGRGINIADPELTVAIGNILPELFKTGQKISQTLKLIENSKPYREMLKKFNMTEEENEDE